MNTTTTDARPRPTRYHPPGGHAVTRDSIQRALQVHAEAGLLRLGTFMTGTDAASYTWTLEVANGDPVTLRGLREAWLFVSGIGTARQALAAQERRTRPVITAPGRVT